MPPPVITHSGDGYRTHRRIPVTDYTNKATQMLSALYATSPDAMANMEMGIPTCQDYDPFFDRIDTPEDDNPWVHTEYFSDREECGEIVFQQIRSLMEDGNSQVLTREHAAEIAKYAIKLLS